jgi:hypothetical protein
MPSSEHDDDDRRCVRKRFPRAIPSSGNAIFPSLYSAEAYIVIFIRIIQARPRRDQRDQTTNFLERVHEQTRDSMAEVSRADLSIL